MLDQKAKPRVLFFLPSLLAGGAELHTLKLHQLLTAEGFDCGILVHGPQASDCVMAQPAAQLAIRLNLRGMSELTGWPVVWSRFRELRPDIIVSINQTPLIVSVLEKAARGTRARLACIFHSTEMQDYESHLAGLFRLAARRADLLVYVGEAQKRLWESRGVSARRVRVIQNGVDLEKFQFSPTFREEARARLGLGPDHYVLGMVAAFRQEKRHVDFLQAIAAARRQGSRVRAIMVGDGPTFDEANAVATELALGDALIFAGGQGDVLPFIAACDAGVLCSSAESFPLAALEFLACGLPMLVSAVSGALELVRNSHNGLAHPVGDISAFAANILALESPERRNALARNARPSVEHLSLKAMAAAYAEQLIALHG
ncbi:glycosyltransferase involved in cell wall biosynthesis [Rhodoblastus acidophilus]|uniref:glycosyltransferase n=1 Tax=Rhodoblastus acidophilus TaxID=1074 RepID=UPI002225AD02|nr:glycosyltransferase [Rhodoblastus acidophilus]MCW2318635.1 glycosyltransferase involved in cell wall biosynthesis [Rhodoblastus acidophilus]